MTDFTQLDSGSIVDLDFALQTLNGANFSNMDLPHLQASEAKLVGASFQGTNLTNANFKGADLRGADLSGANITFADFSDARLDEARFSNCIGIEAANLPNAIKKAYRYADPAMRRFELIRASIIGGGLVFLSISMLVLGNAIWSQQFGTSRQQLEQIQQKIAQEQNALESAKSNRTTAEEDLARLNERVASEQQLLAQLKNDFWKYRSVNSSASTQLTRDSINDLAGSLDQLMNQRPSSVQKYVLYFELLNQIETKY